METNPVESLQVRQRLETLKSVCPLTRADPHRVKVVKNPKPLPPCAQRTSATVTG
ncbi:MAG: hypothetical protein Ct9H300mP11_23280 [Chloroflexota bacterium]|nr:MAG: hypothetical protein Ct9H300mP11_23280 [Chloroflexota bacterium]